MSVIEVRIYTIVEGKRDAFVKLYDEVLLPAQQAFGLDVLGPRANPLMQDTSNVIVVQPTPGSTIQ
jgi:hypothetical protein